ncbi:hypothetical protein DAEQUDRAFT_700148 [Daedalea quercina L-15889]|uniref:Xylanolytic transcriptional activator regulatory domain-containing protein n=1 Tax=Daedalea quercina L-15889 TaxID=1314783 RepID=A0A165KQ12_9APHY|nr:hypothetical protein DAEQUDRAFT_700148 [Daedalea quercina L-15889]
MINVARTMGLANDPDEFPGTYSLFDAEARRRVWWDVFYYDLFVSDCMGHPPLIPDNSFTTHLPADVDEDMFGPSSTVLPGPSEGADGADRSSAYFALKCRLAQLVKNVKKQTFRDPLGEDPNELSIDQAALFEGDVTTFLAELPPTFRLELDRDWAEPTVPMPSTPAASALLAQKCELAILANRLILKLYLPFLKDSHTGSGKHQAVLATLNAAHAIIYASCMLHGVWANTRPAAFDFYDFSRALFDAAVVCAHAVIQQPGSILASEALKGVSCALDVLKVLGSESAADKSRVEAVRVVEMMKRKAEAARSNGVSNGAPAGMKRKRDVLDDERMEAGFQFPYVGPSVSSVKVDPGHSPSKAHNGLAPGKEASLAPPEGRKEKKQMREKDREKDKGRPPPVGIRARPSHPPTVNGRPRGASMSGNAAPVPAPRPLPPPRHTATPGSGPSSAVSSSTSHIQALPPHPAPALDPHDVYAQRPPQTPVQPTPVHEHMSRDDYQMQFSSDDADRRRYSSTFSDSPQGPSLFDPASLSQPSPVSYSTGPTPPNYYQYAPPPGPPHSSQGPPAYENAPPMGHPQNVAPPMNSLSMDASGGQGGLQMSTMVEPRYGMQYRPEHVQPMPTHEYHPSHPPPQPQGIPHAWLPPEQGGGAEMWTEYKYVG